jgi:hypothetical protein
VIEGAKPGQSTRNCGGRRSGEPAGARYLEEVAGFQRRTCGAQLGSTGGRKSWNPQQMGPRWEGYGGGPSGGRRAGRWMWMSLVFGGGGWVGGRPPHLPSSYGGLGSLFPRRLCQTFYSSFQAGPP